MKRSKVIELVLAAVVLLLVCVLVSLHAQDKKDVPQLKDKPAGELARAALPLIYQMAAINTKEAVLQQSVTDAQKSFGEQEQAKATVNAELDKLIAAALTASGIDTTTYTVDLSTMLPVEKPKPAPTPAPPAPQPQPPAPPAARR